MINTDPLSSTIGFIGAGQMARALAAGFVRQQIVTSRQIVAADVVPAASDAFCELVADASGKAQVADSSADLIRQADIVFLAIKPQNVAAVLADLESIDCTDKLFISIVAGQTCQNLATGLGTDRIVRVMPNTPCLIGQGMSVYARYTGATEDDGQLVGRLLAAVGEAIELDESQLDAATGLSGSGPAFVYQVILALAEGGAAVGLAPQVAEKLAARTVFGAAQMVIQSGESPQDLTDRVASPNGTTVAGLAVLERENVTAAISSAVVAAAHRSRELGADKPD